MPKPKLVVMHDELTDEMRNAFAAALQAATKDADIDSNQIAAEITKATGQKLTGAAVRKWSHGGVPRTPQVVFKLERILGRPAGSLSRHLGYLPVGAPPTVAQALEADDEMTPLGRGIVLAAYEQARRYGASGGDQHR